VSSGAIVTAAGVLENRKCSGLPAAKPESSNSPTVQFNGYPVEITRNRTVYRCLPPRQLGLGAPDLADLLNAMLRTLTSEKEQEQDLNANCSDHVERGKMTSGREKRRRLAKRLSAGQSGAVNKVAGCYLLRLQAG